MKLLIDADIVLYKACSAVEREINFEDDMWVLYTEEHEAIEAFNDSLRTLLELANLDSYLLAFSDSANFRKTLYPDYKGNRTQRKPLGFKSIRERVFEQHAEHIKTLPSLEADDVIGITSTCNKGEYMIWSEDKDLRQIPGLHLTPIGQKAIYLNDADKWFYTQILTGDVADNYKGCPGIGPVKAEKILSITPYWDSVVDAYVKAGLTEADALTQARLARILRCEDWDEEKQEVKLWEAPTTA